MTTPRSGTPTTAPSPLAPPSPPPRRVSTPRWLDGRLVTGLVLVVGSVLVGAVLFARASDTAPVWALTRGLPAGAVLTADDLRTVDVRLPTATDAYVPSSRALVGQTLVRPVGANELVPAAAVGDPSDDGAAGLLTVTVPFDRADVPAVTRGDRITVWVSTATCSSATVVDDVAVTGVSTPSGALSGGDTVDVVVRVTPAVADRIVTALALSGATVRAGVRSGTDVGAVTTGPAAAALPDLAACGASSVPSPAGS